MCAIADPTAEEATADAATFTVGFIAFNTTTDATTTGTWSHHIWVGQVRIQLSSALKYERSKRSQSTI